MSDQDDESALGTFTNELDVTIFATSSIVVLIAIIGLLGWTETTSGILNQVSGFLLDSFGWAYLIVMFVLTAFAVYLVFSPWGRIKLGKEDDEPEFSIYSYFAMLYSAGLASGIVFWGPAESVLHYSNAPPVTGAESETMEAAIAGVQYSIFHWGAASWVPHVLIAIPIAFYVYRRDAPMRVSTVLTPIIGQDNLDGALAKLVDTLAAFAVVGGISTTLGFVGSQLITGIEYTTGTTVSDIGIIGIIVGLTVVFTISVSLGVQRGIRVVSYFNMSLFSLIMLAMLILGPTVFIVNLAVSGVGGLINDYVTMSFYTQVGGNAEWLGTWTVFYWAWVFSWAPFVGLFIARISRGRTIREVVLTGVGASTAVAVPWFTIMGGTAIDLQGSGTMDLLGLINEYGEAVSGYPLMEALQFGGILSVMFIVLVITFFITSADSSTLALGMLTTGGKESPSTVNRVIWGGLLGALSSLLFVTGGTEALETAVIITGGPFGIVLLVAVIGLILQFNKIHPLFSARDKTDANPEVAATQDDD